MKAQVRVTEHGHNAYNFTSIEILFEKYGILRMSGYISFQQTKGEDRWYGMHYNIDTDDIFLLENFTKVCKYLDKRKDWDSQPADVLRILKAEKYVFDNNSGKFIPME